MKNEREQLNVDLTGLVAFVVVIVVTTMSVTMSVLYFDDFGFTTPEDGMLNGSYSSPIWNTTQTYNLSIGERYINEKIDFIFFIIVVGFLWAALWSVINFINRINEIEWNDLRHKIAKICFIFKYAAGFIALLPAIAYFGYQIDITFIMPITAVIFMGCVIIEVIYDNFIFKGDKK